MKLKKHQHSLGCKQALALIIPVIMTAQAQALEFNIGQIEGSFDSQLSMGSSWRVESQDAALLSNSCLLYTSPSPRDS